MKFGGGIQDLDWNN